MNKRSYQNNRNASGNRNNECRINPDGTIVLRTTTPQRSASSGNRSVSRPRQNYSNNRNLSRPAPRNVPAAPVVPVFPVVFPIVYNVCNSAVCLVGRPNEFVNGFCNFIVGDNYGRICGNNNILNGNNYGVIEGFGNVVTGNNNGTINGMCNVVQGKNYGYIYGMNNLVYNR